MYLNKYLSYLFVLLLIVALDGTAQKKRFFDYSEGLSNSLINELHQDHLGFLWVATEDGLNRFDGIKFKSYFKNDKLASSLRNNFVTALLEDSKRNLWVGQINNLQVYNFENETFRDIELNVENEQVHFFITRIIETKNNDLWFSTSGHGLFKMDEKKENPEYDKELNDRLNSKIIEYLIEDSEGILWIGTSKGLNSYNPKTGRIESFTVGKDKLSLPDNEVSSLCEDSDGYIYIGFLNGGLAKLNKNTKIIEEIRSANPNEIELPVKFLHMDSRGQLWVGTDGFGLKLLNRKSNLLESYSSVNTSFDFLKSKVHNILEDTAGNIWLGIFQKGIYLIPESPEIFINYGYRAFEKNSIGSNYITGIDGNKNELWITTDGDGIYNINRRSSQVTHIPLLNKNGKIEGENILTLYNDTNRHVWLGRYINGLIRYDKKNKSFKSFQSNTGNSEKNLYSNITSIKKIKNNQLIVSTLGDGIARFDIDKEVYYPGLDIPDSLNNKIPQWILSIFIDENKNLWLGSYVGLYFINLKDKTLLHFSEENGLLKNNTVNCIQSDHKKNIWAGTYEGLVKIDPKNFATQFYDTDNGICNNVICAIKEDEYNQLWISTHNGLSMFNTTDESFTNYFAYDGIQANEFSRNAAFRSEDNELFFGGINGITQIKKNYRNISHPISNIILTDLFLSNKNVSIGDKSGKHIILNKSIVLADTIRIREADNAFTIGFTSVEIANQSRVAYEYKMEGFDLEWHTTNAQNRAATYTNLNHGIYEFYVRGVDRKQYSETRKVTIIIYPPWYKTRWANLLWIILTFLVLYGVFLFYKEKYKLQHALKMDEMKMQFFINISHEIKTPLSLILDPLESLLKSTGEKNSLKLIRIIQFNANRISRLVNQLMDVRKIDKGRILIKFHQTNMLEFIKEIAQSYEILVAQKKINFDIETTDPQIVAWIDTLNFEKVIHNLLSNAFKFTPNMGEIKIFISKDLCENIATENKECVKISVLDSGIGIKESDSEKIFERFYQIDSPESRYSSGTGIGLHLSRSLVKLHKGHLIAENRKDKQGSVFVVTIPLGNEHLPKEDIITEQNALPAPIQKLGFSKTAPASSLHDEAAKKQRSHYKVMVVDDEPEIRSYLHDVLSPFYTVVACENGKKAHEILLDEKPDIIISDIMMPEMDGISFCKKVKRNTLTSHIPIILLTALSKEEDMAEGIETGADMYLVKPFSSDFLKKIIQNILENRRKIVRQTELKPEEEIQNIQINSHNEVLMQKVMKIIKDNISNSELNGEMIAEEIGISRVHLHRKLKELSNQSTRDFIKNVRMKQASYILTTKKINISEVAYALGFSNLSHFSNSFKAYYGVSPKTYIIKQHGKNPLDNEQG